MTVAMVGSLAGCDGCSTPPSSNDAGTITPTTVAVNELMSRNASVARDEAGDFDDWIELVNLTDEEVALDGHTLADSGSDDAPLPAGTVVPARGFLVLFADDSTDPGAPGEPHLPFKLSGAGDSLTLRNAEGNAIDVVTVPALAVDQSFGRLPDGDGLPQLLAAPSPGGPNGGGAGEGEGEGECVSPFTTPPDVLVNEALIDNVDGLADPADGETDPWIELYNAGAAALDLDGLVVADNAGLLAAWPLPAGELAAGDHLLVFADAEPDQGPLHASFILSAVDEVVVLADVCGTTFHALALDGGAADVSVGLVPDGNRDGAGARTPTPEAANQ